MLLLGFEWVFIFKSLKLTKIFDSFEVTACIFMATVQLVKFGWIKKVNSKLLSNVYKNKTY